MEWTDLEREHYEDSEPRGLGSEVRQAAAQGLYCRRGEAGRCSGWVLSPFDTWEVCGCGNFDPRAPHPEDPPEIHDAWAAAQEVPPF